jgi:predicted acyl esterase
MNKCVEEFGLDVVFRPANLLSESVPPVADVEPSRVVLEKGSVHAEGAFPLPCDILLDRDVAIPTRDGNVLRGDVFRPLGEEPVPAILVYTP